MKGREMIVLIKWRGKEVAACFSTTSSCKVQRKMNPRSKQGPVRNILVCLLMAVSQIISRWFAKATVTNENAPRLTTERMHEKEGSPLVQSRPSWPDNTSRTTSRWIINLSASISALESFPNTKAKCPPCSEAALLRVCGYFNKN